MITTVVNTTPIYNPIKSIICLEVKQKMNRTKASYCSLHWMPRLTNTVWYNLAIVVVTLKLVGCIVIVEGWRDLVTWTTRLLEPRISEWRDRTNQSMWISKPIKIWLTLTKKQSFWQYKLVNHYIAPIIHCTNYGYDFLRPVTGTSIYYGR